MNKKQEMEYIYETKISKKPEVEYLGYKTAENHNRSTEKITVQDFSKIHFQKQQGKFSMRTTPASELWTNQETLKRM